MFGLSSILSFWYLSPLFYWVTDSPLNEVVCLGLNLNIVCLLSADRPKKIAATQIILLPFLKTFFFYSGILRVTV